MERGMWAGSVQPSCCGWSLLLMLQREEPWKEKPALAAMPGPPSLSLWPCQACMGIGVQFVLSSLMTGPPLRQAEAPTST